MVACSSPRSVNKAIVDQFNGKRKIKGKKGHISKRHNTSNFMPTIKPNPTLNKASIDKLPKIIADCQAELNDWDIYKAKVRLNFADHNDIRKLNGIRVVDPDRIRLPSKESTMGCYHPGNKSGSVFIWAAFHFHVGLLEPCNVIE